MSKDSINKDYINEINAFNNSIKKYKPDRCLICNNSQKPFCYSHTIPQFVLKRIAKNGKLVQGNAIYDFENRGMLKLQRGVGDSGVIRCICRECDKSFFHNYEDVNNIEAYPSSQVLLEISLKNILYSLYSNFRNKGLYEHAEEKINCRIKHNNSNDKEENEKLFEKIINNQNGLRKISYSMMFYHKLDYVVPIAFQERVFLYGDLEGNILDDVYDFEYKNVLCGIDICVFPLEETSIVMMFIDKENEGIYESFIKQFEQLDLEKQLEIINYIIFVYCENFYINPDYLKYLKDTNLQFLLGLILEGCPYYIGVSKGVYKTLLKNRTAIPNFLSKELALK